MIKTYTCIICPLGCDIETDFNEETKEIFSLKGATCKRGESYIQKELTDPQRTIQTSIKVIGGDLPLTSVKVSGPIPKNKIFDCMAIIKTIEVKAPIESGHIAYKNICDLGVDIIVTKSIDKKSH